MKTMYLLLMKYKNRDGHEWSDWATFDDLEDLKRNVRVLVKLSKQSGTKLIEHVATTFCPVTMEI